MKNNEKNKTNDIYKQKVINQIAIALSLFVCIITCLVINLIPEELDIEYIQENYIPDTTAFVAEKTETLKYLTSIVSFPICYLIFNLIFKKILKNYNNEKIYSKINNVNLIVGLFLFVVITLLAILNQLSYFKDDLVYRNLYVCIPVCIIALIVMFWNYNTENKINFKGKL